MKKLLLMAAMVLSTLGMQAEDKVTAKVSGSNLNIGLENSTSFVAFQMDIQLPAGVTASKVDKTGRLKQGANVTIDSESVETPFVVATNVLEGNVLRVVAYNLGNYSIDGVSGDILKVALNSSVADPADVKVSNIKFVNAAALAEFDLAAVNGEKGGKRGDMTGEGDVDVEDVTIILNMSLGLTPKTPEADLTGEGDVDVEDVTVALNISLGLQ